MERLAQCSVLAIILVHFLIYALSSPDGFLFVPSTHTFFSVFVFVFLLLTVYYLYRAHTFSLPFVFFFSFSIASCFCWKGWAWLFGEIGLDVNNSVCGVSALLGMCKVHNLFSFAINSLWCNLYIHFGIFWIKIYLWCA